MNILVAPHPDDEIIGGYSLFQTNSIDLVIIVSGTEERLKESKKFLDYMHVPYVFLGFRELTLIRNMDRLFEVLKTFVGDGKNTWYVPSAQNKHLDHIIINLVISNIEGEKIGYDINSDKTKLTIEEQRNKEDIFRNIYKSQEGLLRSINLNENFNPYQRIVLKDTVVIVPTIKNRPKALSITLSSLYNENCDIFIVPDAITDITEDKMLMKVIEILEKTGKRILIGEKKGYPYEKMLYVFNLYKECETFFRIDDDCYVTPGAINQAVLHLTASLKGPIVGVGCSMGQKRRKTLFSKERERFASYYLLDKPVECNFIGGFFCFKSKYVPLLPKINIGFKEDRLISNILKSQGKLITIPEIIYHLEAPSTFQDDYNKLIPLILR